MGPDHRGGGLLAILANIVQTGPIFTFVPLKPKGERVNPMAGFKRVFNKKMLFEAFKSLLKLRDPGRHHGHVLHALWPQLAGGAIRGYGCGSGLVLESRRHRSCFAWGSRSLLIGLLDFLYTRHKFKNDMMMSRREMKEEVKRREGDPLIRAKLRELQRENLKQAASVKRVPEADVLITNPDHLAIALRYERGSMAAPIMLAKGADSWAAEMRATARRHGIPDLPAQAAGATPVPPADSSGSRFRRTAISTWRASTPSSTRSSAASPNTRCAHELPCGASSANRRSSRSSRLLGGILMVLFAPIPPGLLDFLLIANFSFALVILLLTFYMGRPLEFSTFPSLLLVATLFRLSLNIAATRLILSEASAGHVIEAIGNHVVGGNYVIGLIVFLVLIIVQFVVVTNGAQRVAEVAARFTLDSHARQADEHRRRSQHGPHRPERGARAAQADREGSELLRRDGRRVSRFVKGDAIAGILIILVNIIGGLTIGVAQHDMTLG